MKRTSTRYVTCTSALGEHQEIGQRGRCHHTEPHCEARCGARATPGSVSQRSALPLLLSRTRAAKTVIQGSVTDDRGQVHGGRRVMNALLCSQHNGCNGAARRHWTDASRSKELRVGTQSWKSVSKVLNRMGTVAARLAGGPLRWRRGNGRRRDAVCVLSFFAGPPALCPLAGQRRRNGGVTVDSCCRHESFLVSACPHYCFRVLGSSIARSCPYCHNPGVHCHLNGETLTSWSVPPGLTGVVSSLAWNVPDISICKPQQQITIPITPPFEQTSLNDHRFSVEWSLRCTRLPRLQMDPDYPFLVAAGDVHNAHWDGS